MQEDDVIITKDPVDYLQEQTFEVQDTELAEGMNDFATVLPQHCDNQHSSKCEIKGYKKEKEKGIVCLDCGKCFKYMKSYDSHKKK